MRTFALLRAAVCLAFVTLTVGLLHDTSGKDTPTDPITALVKQLGDDSFDQREAAAKALQALGEKALPALVAAAAASEDLEVRRRARRLVRVLLPETRKSKSTGLEMVRVHAG